MAFVGHKNQFYEPRESDVVIGVIWGRNMDEWLVDIASSHFASLPQLAFDGASKKNYPKFERGDLVAAAVAAVPKPDEVLLTCVRGAPLGKLEGGTLLRCRSADAERTRGMLSRANATTVIGRNGRIFVRGEDDVASLRIVDCVLRALRSDDPDAAFDSAWAAGQ